MSNNQQTVDLTPTWEGLIPMLAHVAVNGDTEQARRAAMHELLKLARIVDQHIAQLKALEAEEEHRIATADATHFERSLAQSPTRDDGEPVCAECGLRDTAHLNGCSQIRS